METLHNTGIKLFVLAALEEHQLRVSFALLFFFLDAVVPVSMQYILCLVTVRMRVL
jgi:hypothetical protein